MEEYGSFDMPSPSSSLYYMYGDAEPYVESHTSGSQSPSNSLYDVTSGADFGGISDIYPSPEREEDDSQPSQQQKPAAKRKRENRYKNAPPSVLSRRRAQNRASQRAYRERKDQRIKDLEQMLSDAKQRNDVLGQAYASLHAEYISLKASQLKDQSYAADLGYSPTMGMPTANDGLDLDMFVYSDMHTGGYSL
ncbi:hypothetical protein B0T25DRAFT_565036 [Lasiosphaeria hispida]|uniref:Putative transcription factor kapC n=1 Tax=Lasiosphaeria hispida TaxID=260671 RepID=A0AAJ0MI93_9PEZI|nr:hypothetical protein B0T25DRAFT_565036 [Lasiosphaeria hispida]